jgi:phospholipase/carboxylesterase
MSVNGSPGATGKQTLGIGAERDGFIYVPASLDRGPLPLLVFFHGAGADAAQADSLLRAAEQHRLLILSIDSRGTTWDMIDGEIGPDVAFLDAALRLTFERYAIDAAHIAFSGFSDGASYALSLGLANGHLFTHVLAFSPGFSSPPHRSGSPKLFVSHGTSDNILPINACSRRIVPRLRRDGYVVEYREFEGGHAMPAELVEGALEWMMEDPANR